MQSRNTVIEELREILIFAKTHLYQNGRCNVELSDHTVEVLIIIGKEQVYELSNEMYDLLDSDDEVVRETVVETLGATTGLNLPEFKETAYKIWLEDKDENVRQSALATWASYYIGSKNPEVLKILYKILVDENYPIDHRRTAMQKIFSVSGEPSNFYNPFDKSKHFYMVSSHIELNQKIDWNEIKAIMKKYVPDALL
jgi:hypothetical protein